MRRPILLLALMLITLMSPAYAQQPVEPDADGRIIVGLDEVAVVFDALTGELLEPLRPGTHQLDPLRQQATRYHIGQQAYTELPADASTPPADPEVEGRTADGIGVRVTYTLLYSVDPARVNDLHARWGGRYAGDFIRPVSRSVIRDMLATYDAVTLFGPERATFTRLVEQGLTGRLEEEGLVLHELLIGELNFPTEFVAAVEARAVAQTAVETAQLAAETARLEAIGQADAARIRAQAEAEADLLRAEALVRGWELISEPLADNPLLLYMVYIEMLATTASQWRTPPTLALPGSATPPSGE